MNLPDWFPEKWNDEVKLRTQQMKPAVADTVSSGGMFTADRVYFPRIGQVDAIESRRLMDLAANGAPLDWIDLQATPKFLPIKIWDPDVSKLTISVVEKFAKVVAAGIARAQDAMVVAAFNNAAVNGVQASRGHSADASAAPDVENIPTIGDYNTVMDLDTIAQAYALLGTNFALEGAKVTMLQPFKLKVNNSLDPYMAKNDVKDNLPWNDLRWRSYEKLYGNGADGYAASGTGADCYMYVEDAAVTAYNTDVTDINERLGASLTNMIGQWFQGGAAVTEPKGIVRIKTKTDFTIARKPIPIIDMA